MYAISVLAQHYASSPKGTNEETKTRVLKNVIEKFLQKSESSNSVSGRKSSSSIKNARKSSSANKQKSNSPSNSRSNSVSKRASDKHDSGNMSIEQVIRELSGFAQSGYSDED